MGDINEFLAHNTGSMLPDAQPQIATAVTPGVPGDDMLVIETRVVPFDELLLAQIAIESGIETELPQEGGSGDALLPNLTDGQTEEIAQQFLASLVNREVLVFITPTAPQTMSSEGVNVAIPEALSAGFKENVSPYDAPEQTLSSSFRKDGATLAALKDHPETALPKVAVTQVSAQTLRTIAHNLTQGENLPAFSAGKPQLQANAPLRIESSGLALSSQLHHALGERLNLQINNQIQHATIRLDPPDMGRIEIAVQIEAGKIQVQINAGQGDVYRALQQMSNDLRQALTAQHFVEVDVRVLSHSAQQQQSGRQQPQHGSADSVILANEQPESRRNTPSRDDKSILMTV